MRVEGVEVHVKETEYCARRSWGGDIHAERIPLVPGRELHAEDAVEHQLPPSLALPVEHRRAKTLAGEQRHGREWSAVERRVVLSVGCQEARAYSGIVEEGLSELGEDVLELNNIGKLGPLQDVIEDELGACDVP